VSALRIYVPGDAVAVACGADEIAAAMSAAASKRKLDATIVRNGSRGMHWLEPMLEVATPAGRIAYGPVELADVETVLVARPHRPNMVGETPRADGPAACSRGLVNQGSALSDHNDILNHQRGIDRGVPNHQIEPQQDLGGA